MTYHVISIVNRVRKPISASDLFQRLQVPVAVPGVGRLRLQRGADGDGRGGLCSMGLLRHVGPGAPGEETRLIQVCWFTTHVNYIDVILQYHSGYITRYIYIYIYIY